MLWFKYSFIVFIFVNSNVWSFSSRQCLDSEFKNSITNDGKYYGLLKNHLKVSKNDCEIVVHFRTILETKWTVDICREPVHMKIFSKGNQSVHKRKSECKDDDDREYCQLMEELTSIVQDHGLIFAGGDRSTLDSDHGQVYCAYLLLKKYLKDGYIFSKHEKDVDVFSDPIEEESCELPKAENSALENESNVQKAPIIMDPDKPHTKPSKPFKQTIMDPDMPETKPSKPFKQTVMDPDMPQAEDRKF